MARHGLAALHRASLAALAASVWLLSVAAAAPAVGWIAGALFGAAYLMLTGVYLVWGTAALPERPATGIAAAFVMLALGKMAGAPVFGLMPEGLGAAPALGAFAALGMAASALERRPSLSAAGSPC